MANRKSPDDDTIPMTPGPSARAGQVRSRGGVPGPAPLSPAEVVADLERSLRVLMNSASHPRIAYDGLRQAWLPPLVHALTQLGGDGLDAWVASLFRPPGRLASDAFFADLVAALQRMRGARDVAHLEEEALKAIELVRRVSRAGAPRPLSTAVADREVAGPLDLEDLLGVAIASDDDLRRRLSEIGGAMQGLKDQLTSRPGSQPAGMYGDFVRLKAELRLVDAELRRRFPDAASDATPVV